MKTLQDILLKADHQPWNFALFLPPEKPWSLDSRCMTLDADDCDEDEVYPEAAARGLSYVIGIQDVQSIVENARQQKPEAEADDLFQAFTYYLNNDAFIVFE